MIVHELKALFKDRRDAGSLLAAQLGKYAGSQPLQNTEAVIMRMASIV
jgi:hypothetical protein